MTYSPLPKDKMGRTMTGKRRKRAPRKPRPEVAAQFQNPAQWGRMKWRAPGA